MKNIKLYFIGLTITLLLTSCVHTTKTMPKNHSSLKNVEKISDINGTYENYAHGPRGKTSIAISKMVWPKASAVTHSRIKKISIHSFNNQSVLVRALGSNLFKRYVADSTRKIKNGSINLETSQGSTTTNPLFLTFIDNKKSKKVRLDKNRNLILEQSRSTSGLFLGIPMSEKNITYLRFNRVSH